MRQPHEGRDPAHREPRKTLPEVGRYSGYGLTIALSTALFAWLGKLLDERFRTGPLFVIVGTFVGFGASFYSMYRQLVLDRPPAPPASGGRDGNGDGDGDGDGERSA
ncbi:MAG: AtpZ/AtpI family protein [Gemmatimonadota bacterium]